MRRLALLLALAACKFHGRGTADDVVDPDAALDGDGVPQSPWLDGFDKRKPITLVGGDVELVDFAANIAATDPDLVGTAGIAFTRADGTTPLPFEQLTLDVTSGTIDAWVKTTVAANTTTTIYLYFDGAPISPAPTADVWTQFAGAWHMTIAPDGNSDDSAADHRATNANAAYQPAKAGGISGVARDYDGIDDHLVVGDPTDGSLDVGDRSFGFSVWVNVAQNHGGYDMPLFKGGSSSNTPGFDIELGSGHWVTSLNDTSGNSQQEVEFATAGMYDEWHFLAGVIDRAAGTAITYVDGEMINTAPYAKGSMDSGSPLTIGDGSYRFLGLIDEVRIYKLAPPPAWVRAEYANLAMPSAFVTVGATETQ